MSREFIDCVYLFETRDSIPYLDVSIGMGAFAYKLDKQNTDFIQLIKDAEGSIEPLRVTTERFKSGVYITKVTEISETEKKEFMESYKWQSCLDNAETSPKK